MSLVPWNAPLTVNTTTNGNQTYPTIAQLKDGSMVVTWTDISSGNGDVKFQRYDSAGNKLGVETLAHGANAGNQQQCNITALTNGSYVISYVDVESNTLFAQKFTSAGVAVGGATPLSSPAFFYYAEFAAPVVQALAGGAYAVIYYASNFGSAASGRDLVGRIVDAAGVPGAAFNVATSTASIQSLPTVTLDASGNLAVAWASSHASSADDIYMGRFSPSGVSLTSEITTINTITDDTQTIPSITRLSNGLFVVTWTSTLSDVNHSTDIRGQIVDANGFFKLGPEFLVGTTEVGSQLFSDVVPLADGKFMVIYTTDAAGNEPLRAQMFNSNGTTAGAELLISATGMGNYTVPSAITLADGRVALTWADNAADGSGTGIRMQILDPREGVFTGTAGADTIYGHDSVGDIISAGDGADTVYGLASADTIYGGAGDDFIYGGRGDDTSHGGDNNDRLYGDLGDDEQYGDTGSDVIYSGRGADLLDGGVGVGSDTAYYSSEKTGAIINLLDQTLNAGSADGDTLLNFESIFGSNIASDNITGSNANETILGNGGADILNGSGGNDTLRGGLGVDTLNGGIGADKFQYTALNEVGDVIINYEAVDDFQFTRAAFGNLVGANVAAVNFLSVASGHAAATVSQLFIFDQALDQLWYDADGSNAGAAVLVADLSNNINVTNLDLLLI